VILENPETLNFIQIKKRFRILVSFSIWNHCGAWANNS